MFPSDANIFNMLSCCFRFFWPEEMCQQITTTFSLIFYSTQLGECCMCLLLLLFFWVSNYGSRGFNHDLKNNRPCWMNEWSVNWIKVRKSCSISQLSCPSPTDPVARQDKTTGDEVRCSGWSGLSTCHTTFIMLHSMMLVIAIMPIEPWMISSLHFTESSLQMWGW